MTTIAYRNGVLAADSRCTYDTEGGGVRHFLCEKLFRKTIASSNGDQEEVILATAGESYSGMVFVDWYGSGKEVPDVLIHGDADFTVLILKKDGLYEADKWCRPIKVLDEFYAIGSGTKAALGAMHMGASAQKAVEIACRIEPYSAPPIQVMRLGNGKPKVSKVRRNVAGATRVHAGREAAMALPEQGGPADPMLQHDKPVRHDAGSGGQRRTQPQTAGFLTLPTPDQMLHNNGSPERYPSLQDFLDLAVAGSKISKGRVAGDPPAVQKPDKPVDKVTRE